MSQYKNFYDKWKLFLLDSPKVERLDELNYKEAKEIEDWISTSSPEKYSFDNLFGNKMRILIPLKFAEENLSPSAKDMLQKVKAFIELSDIWSYDNESLSRGSVYKINQPKDFGPDLNLKRYKRETPPPAKRTEQKIVKFLSRFSNSKKLDQDSKDKLSELSMVWGDEADKLIYSQGSIIITRHPMDVARMADIDGVRSCHSPGGDFYKCAVEEAMGNAPVAYYVSKNQLDKLLGDEDISSLDNQEIIFDKDRGIEGITPTSRLRLRKFTGKKVNKEDFELAIPELTVYGNPTAHFRETVTQWALNSQLNQITSDPEQAEKLRNMSWREEYIEAKYKVQVAKHGVTRFQPVGSAGDWLEYLVDDMKKQMHSLFPDFFNGDIKWHGGSYKDSHTTDMFINFFGISKKSAADVDGPWMDRGLSTRNSITELFPAKFFEYIKEKYHTNSDVFRGSEMSDVKDQITEFMYDFEESVLQGYDGEGGSHQGQGTGAYNRVMDIYRSAKQEIENAYDRILQTRANSGFLTLGFEDEFEDEDDYEFGPEVWGEMLESMKIPVNYYIKTRFLLYFPEEYQDFGAFIDKKLPPERFAGEVKAAVQEIVGGKAAEVWKYIWWAAMTHGLYANAYERAGKTGWELEFETYLGDEEEESPETDGLVISKRKKQILNDIKSFKIIVAKKAEILENIKNRISILYQEDGVKEDETSAEPIEEAKRGRKKTIRRKTAKRRTAKRNKRVKKKSEKKDACYHKVRSRYDVWPSAYASGALVKCRKMGAKNWGNSSKKKKTNERLDYGQNLLSEEMLESMVIDTLIREILEEKKKKTKKKGRKLTQKASSEADLRDWFKRKGAKGKKGGWVDCNTCRKDKKTGRKKCSPCGRSDGEKRAKYPSCRPTPGACSQKGKGEKWGKKSKKSS
jgi:hypothetical protein